MAYRQCALLPLGSILTALAGCGVAEPAATGASGTDYSGTVLHQLTPMQVCMLECRYCNMNFPAACRNQCVYELNEATSACEEAHALLNLCRLGPGPLYGTGTCTANMTVFDCSNEARDYDLCREEFGCDPLTGGACRPQTADNDMLECQCSKECLSGSLYRTACTGMSTGIDSILDCECFADEVLVGTCQQPYFEQGWVVHCDMWDGCCHQFYPLVPE